MARATTRFFEALAQRKDAPAFRDLSGTIRCDLKDGKRTRHWYVTVRKGDITISHSTEKADCTFATDVATFEAILAGKMNAFAAVLRGACAVEGKVRMLIALQSIFTPSEGAPAREAAGYARRPT
jgi:putative sterol carrier protein